MKRDNMIVAMIFAAGLATTLSAKAESQVQSAPETTTEMTKDTDEQQNAKMDEVKALLKRLNDMDAIESDKAGNIRVKQSVLEQLRIQDRVTKVPAQAGSICN